jgi:hypothetical protein
MKTWNNVLARRLFFLSLPIASLPVIARSPLFLSLRGAEGDEAISEVLNLVHLKFEFV